VSRMAADDTLLFAVKGSAAEPYRLSSTGRGADFFIRCSCPAFVRGGAFCKHAAALLMGDIEGLVEGTEGLAALREASAGSRAFAQALAHRPARPRLEDMVVYVDSLEALQALTLVKIDPLKFGLALSESLMEARELGAFRRIKSGALRKHPVVSLRYEPYDWHDVWGGGEQVAEIVGRHNVGPRSRPWIVRAPSRPTTSYGSLPRAAHVFLAAFAYI
jgi:SWIM zinc finger